MNTQKGSAISIQKKRNNSRKNDQKPKFQILFPIRNQSPREKKSVVINSNEKINSVFYKKFFQEKLFPMTSKNGSMPFKDPPTFLEKLNISSKIISIKSPLMAKERKNFSPDRSPMTSKHQTPKVMLLSPDSNPFNLKTKNAQRISQKFPVNFGDKLMHNFTKLRIVSKDKIDVETKKSNFMPNALKEPLVLNQKVKLPQPVSSPQKINFYIKMEKLAAKKSRSIEPIEKSTQKCMKENSRKLVNQSEDKNQTKYVLQENFFSKNKEMNETLCRLKTVQKSTNRFYKILKNEFDKSEEIKMISDHIAKSFQNWNKKSLVKVHKFKTVSLFYRRIERIGMGCFGKVYLATQILTGTQVALKVISKTDIQNKNFRSKIEKEIEILQQVNNCRFVIKLMEVFEDDTSVYFVFEYLKNGDLIKYFKKNQLMDEEELKPFFAKILKGVQYLHDNKIIHRDIKLDNILLDSNLQPKICDFGISSIKEEGKKIMDTGGTPAYLAPEVIKSEGKVCEKSDVWSLGVLLFLLNFGTVPFKSQDMQNLYSKILIGHFKFPDYEEVSFELMDLIKKMLNVDLDKRLSIEEIYKHRWLKGVDPIVLDQEELESNIKIEKEIEEAAYMYFLDLGFAEEYLQQSFQLKCFNHLKACLDCLKIRFKGEFAEIHERSTN